MLTKVNSNRAFKRAQHLIPGGVNSPVRAFKAVGGEPIFMQTAQGAFMNDIDGNQYIDLINSWGPLILGHAHPEIEAAVIEAVKKSLSFGAPTRAEVTMADLIVQMIPSVEKVRMVNSGTEATMSAIRLARAYTGKDKIIKFEGCYHGHADSFLIAAGSGAATIGVPDSPGVTQGTAADTITVPFNNLDSTKEAVQENEGKIAAIILEPVAGNMGCIAPQPGFLQGLRDLCTAKGILLIFDEVMTGFRISKGGAQQFYNVLPDLTTLGKIIGGGMPVGAYGGKAEIMNHIAPAGPVYQAGTLSGNPVAMAAGIAMLKHLNQNEQIYTDLAAMTDYIVKGIKMNLIKLGLKYKVNSVGSMFSLFFAEEQVIDFEGAKNANLEFFSRYFDSMLEKGVYLAPSQFETLFVSTAIGEIEADLIIQANYESLREIIRY